MTIHARIELPIPEELSESGKKVLQSILSTRRNLDGPFLVWLHSPEFASRAETLGAFCRYETQLLTAESELLILIVAARFRCVAEWQIHAPIAQQAGLEANTIESIRVGDAPAFSDLRLAHLYTFAAELVSRNRISDLAFEEAKGEFSLKELVEIVGVLGYYTLVAMTLNSFEMRVGDLSSPFE